MNNLEPALKYLKTYHFSVIPCGKNKKALIPWEEYQKRLPTEEEITKWWVDFPEAQIGIVTGIISGICVVDLDDPEAEKTFNEIVPESLLMPTVYTPRGGKHHYFKCTDSELTNKAMLLGKKMDFRANGGYVLAPPSTNGKGNAYSFIKGLSIKDTTIPILPDSVLSILSSSLKQQEICQPIKSDLQDLTKPYIILQNGRRDNDLFHIANCLVKNKTPEQEVWQVLEILAKNCIPPFPENEIKIKIESALKRVARRERNLAHEILQFLNLTKGYINLTELYNTLQILTKEEKNNVYVIMNRLVKEGIIERYGKKNGVYRKLETEIEEIDIFGQEEEEINIRWPFGIESLVKTMAKNIVILAGTPNAGKTAFLLNLIEMNMDRFDIHYFISEMGKGELKTRLKKFDRPIKSWKFHSYERSNNFADVIKPNAINIVDFMEIYQEHYLIGQWIKDIYDKLDKGIAVIAIQKKPGASMGVGGLTTLEKARLYMTMDSSHILKIEKGKNWTNELKNPNKRFIDFKLVQGCKFIYSGDWRESIE